MLEFFLNLALTMLLGLALYWLGYQAGKRAGLRAPLSRRQAALRADVRRAENAMGVVLPTVRKVRFSRLRKP